MSEKLNILQRINEAMKHKDLKTIEKKLIPTLGYKCFTSEDVIEGCRNPLIENGIVFSILNVDIKHLQYDKTNNAGKTKGVHYFIVTGTARFTNIDDKDDYFNTVFYGSAEDDSDKAIGKANTYAKKIALMNTFLIQDGEDTDANPSCENIKSSSTIKEDIPAKDVPLSIKTNSLDMISTLEERDFKKTKAFKDKTTDIWQKWVSPSVAASSKEWLKKEGYFYNAEKYFYENNFNNNSDL